MKYPDQLKYTKDHEWALIEGKKITVGITHHAQDALGDIVFVELPEVGRVLKSGGTFGVVESIKAVSDLYSPISGKVVERNEAAISDPSLINKEPQGKAWLIKVELDGALPADLMDSGAYTKFVESLK